MRPTTRTDRLLLACGVVAITLALPGCVALVGGLGASWHYDRNTTAFEAENERRQEQGLPPITREEWNAAREAKAAGDNPPEPQ
jgi:hypothetical protein